MLMMMMMMMMIGLRKKSSHYPIIITTTTTTNFILLLNFSTSATKTRRAAADPRFAIDYLINSCGLPPDKAAKASKWLSHLRSSSQPDSVLQFFKLRGFTAAQIAQVISTHPRFLCSNVHRCLEPKMRAIQALGFSDSELVRIVSANPFALTVADPGARIAFWRSLLRSNEALIKALGRDLYLLTSSMERRVLPNIALLRECGVSDRQVAMLVRTTPWLINKGMAALAELVRRTEALGVPRGSGMFAHLLHSLFSISEATLGAKVGLLRGFGWSEAEVAAAVCKSPVLLRMSLGNTAGTMEFLTKEARCTPAYVAAHPTMLSYSLERRLAPRLGVLRLLNSKELSRKSLDLYNTMAITDRKFIDKFILPYEEKVPGLLQAYNAASLGKDAKFCWL